MTTDRWIALVIFVLLMVSIAVEWRFIDSDDPR